MSKTQPATTVSKEAALALIGGKWPDARGFAFDLLDEFRILSSGFLQGFHAGEPVGPAIEYSILGTH
jgi:hypothetical protein